jgi:hypothetical protein
MVRIDGRLEFQENISNAPVSDHILKHKGADVGQFFQSSVVSYPLCEPCSRSSAMAARPRTTVPSFTARRLEKEGQP